MHILLLPPPPPPQYLHGLATQSCLLFAAGFSWRVGTGVMAGACVSARCVRCMQVGETIQVVFRNMCPFDASVHPHGVKYTKSEEGAPHRSDGSNETADDAVPEGGTHTYTWTVPKRAGPADGGPSSVVWMYHSHADEVADTNAGLVGPIVITAAGWGTDRDDPRPRDVDDRAA
jgi:FtsP/CotA-like multicopper oxidase with cupredoxin domain